MCGAIASLVSQGLIPPVKVDENDAGCLPVGNSPTM